MKATPLRVALHGFEPGIGHSLESLLAAEPNVEIVRLPRRWNPGEDTECVVPDVLVAIPPSVSWVEQVRTALPRTRLVVMLEWQLRDHFVSTPVNGIFDRFQSYQGLLDMVLAQQEDG